MLKSIWKNRSSGCLVGYTMSIWAARCLCIQPLWGRRNMTGRSAMVRGSSNPCKTSTRRLLLWKVSTSTSPGRISRACTRRYTSFKGYLVGAILKRPQKSNSERKSWPPSRNTYGLVCHWKMKGNIHLLPLPEEILEPHTMVLSAEHRAYKGLTAREWGQDNKIPALTRDTHSASRWHSRSCQWSRNCQHSGSWHPRSRMHQGRDS